MAENWPRIEGGQWPSSPGEVSSLDLDEVTDRVREANGHLPRLLTSRSQRKRRARRNNQPAHWKAFCRAKKERDRAKKASEQLKSNAHLFPSKPEAAIALCRIENYCSLLDDYEFLFVRTAPDNITTGPQRHYDWRAGDFEGWTYLSKNSVVIDVSDEKNPVLVCIYTPFETLVPELDNKAATLFRIREFYRSQERTAWKGENKMAGKMYAHGYRAGYDKGRSWGKYVLKEKIRDRPDIFEPYLAELDRVVEDYWTAMQARCARQALDIIRVAEHLKTPRLANTPAGNLTVTIDAATPSHTDHDAYIEDKEEEEEDLPTFAFGLWFDYNRPTIKTKPPEGGQFFFPQYRIYCRVSHGTSIIWSGRDTLHGTAKLFENEMAARIGTSIQLVEQLCQRCKKH